MFKLSYLNSNLALTSNFLPHALVHLFEWNGNEYHAGCWRVSNLWDGYEYFLEEPYFIGENNTKNKAIWIRSLATNKK